MSRKPSAETELKSVRRELKKLKEDLLSANTSCRNYRERATKAEQECADWKKRFDQLLFNASKVALDLVDARLQAKPGAGQS